MGRGLETVLDIVAMLQLYFLNGNRNQISLVERNGSSCSANFLRWNSDQFLREKTADRVSRRESAIEYSDGVSLHCGLPVHSFGLLNMPGCVVLNIHVCSPV